MEENVAAFARFALDVAFKATVLLGITAVALLVLRRASAAAPESSPTSTPTRACRGRRARRRG